MFGLGSVTITEIPQVIARYVSTSVDKTAVYPIYSADVPEKMVSLLRSDPDLLEAIATYYKKYVKTVNEAFASVERLTLESALLDLVDRSLRGLERAGHVLVQMIDRDSWLITVSIPEEGVNAAYFVQGPTSAIRAVELAFRKALESRGLSGRYVLFLDVAHRLYREYRKRKLEKIELQKTKI